MPNLTYIEGTMSEESPYLLLELIQKRWESCVLRVMRKISSPLKDIQELKDLLSKDIFPDMCGVYVYEKESKESRKFPIFECTQSSNLIFIFFKKEYMSIETFCDKGHSTYLLSQEICQEFLKIQEELGFKQVKINHIL